MIQYTDAYIPQLAPICYINITMTSHVRHAVSNHRSFDCLLNNLCRPTSKKHQRPFMRTHIKDPYYWTFGRGILRWLVNSPAQRASNAVKASFWWRHHEYRCNNHNNHAPIFNGHYPKILTIFLFIKIFSKLQNKCHHIDSKRGD